jgi:hypothetical protein
MTRPAGSPAWYYVFGVAFVLYSLVAGYRTANFLASAARTRGTVVDWSLEKMGRPSRPLRVRFPEVYFEDPPGTPHRVTGKAEIVLRSRIGDEFEVVYPPGMPHKAELGGFHNQWSTTVYVGVAGIALLVLGWRRALAQS